MRAAVYIDGFNLYKGSLATRPHLKWLDLVAFARMIRPDDEIVRVRYFTANVSGYRDAGAPKRQQVYLRALRAYKPLLDVIPGHFTKYPEHRYVATAAEVPPHAPPLTYDPSTLPSQVWVIEPQEKGSDVNLASHLLVDAFVGAFEVAAVISNDTDLVEPIRMVNERWAPVHVIAPNRHHALTLEAVAATYSALVPESLIACQLPSSIRLPGGREVTRPRDWR